MRSVWWKRTWAPWKRSTRRAAIPMTSAGDRPDAVAAEAVERLDRPAQALSISFPTKPPEHRGFARQPPVKNFRRCLRLVQPATAGAVAANQELIANKLAAPADEDRRTAGQARPVLLVVIGRRASEPQAVWRDAQPPRGAACARRVTRRASEQPERRVAERASPERCRQSGR